MKNFLPTKKNPPQETTFSMSLKCQTTRDALAVRQAVAKTLREMGYKNKDMNIVIDKT